MSLTENPWLGTLLGKPAYKLAYPGSRLTKAKVPQSECFLESRVDVNDSEGLSHLQFLGFTVIDCNFILQRAGKALSPSPKTQGSANRVRFANINDEPGVRGLAEAQFRHDRFHRDPLISDSVASKIKAAWAGNFFKGQRGTWMIIAEDGEGVCGFMLLVIAENSVIIDLLAVDPRSRRQGLAHQMAGFALRNCEVGGRRPFAMSVTTQLSNRQSLEFYQTLGFSFGRAEYILHMHIGA